MSLPVAGSEVVDARTVAEAITALKKVETRWLVANGRGFGDEDATSIARALRSNFTLQELSLAGNHIGPDGAAALGAALGNHPALREVYLQKNKFLQSGIERFSANLKSGGGAKTLQVLNVSHNQLGPTLPSDLALSTLTSLQVKGNSISEIPSIFGQCGQLESVVLDGNPLQSPSLDLYLSHGWVGMRNFLTSTLEAEKAENARVGLGATSHKERDESLFSPIHKAIKEGMLQAGLEGALKAREIYTRLGAKERANKDRVEELIDTITQLRVMECPEMGQHPMEYVLVSYGQPFYVSKDVLMMRAPMLESVVNSHGEEVEADFKGRTVTRKMMTVDGAGQGGLKCLLSYFHLSNLAKALELCCGQEAFAETPMDALPASSESSCSAKTDSSTTHVSERVSPVPGPGPAAAALPDSTAIRTPDCKKQDSFEYPPSQMQPDDLRLEGLPVDLEILYDVLSLARRFDIDDIYQAGSDVLLERLRRSNVCVALVVAHIRRELLLKQVCLNYIKDFCSDFSKQDWIALQDHGTLMLEVMEVASSRSGKESPRTQVSHLMMSHLLRRLEAAEHRAEHETQLRKAAEAQIRKSAEMQLEYIRAYQYS